MGPNHRITYCSTALLATVAGLGVLGFLLWYQSRMTQIHPYLFTGVSALLICYGISTIFLGKLPLLDVASAVGRTSNLTGRGDVWAALLPALMKQPLLGYGYGGFWSTAAREAYDISDSHNGYLAVILEIGFVGLILYSVFLLSATKAAERLLNYDYRWGALCLMFVVGILIHNVGEASLNSFNAALTAVFLLLNVSCSNGAHVMAGTEPGQAH